MAIGHARRPNRGGMPGMGAGRGSFGSRPGMGMGAMGSMGRIPSMAPKPPVFGSRPSAPSSPVNINIGNSYGGGGGLMGMLIGNAVSAGVGVASAAIVNKMQENSQMKLAEQQAKQQQEMQRLHAEQQVEIERIKVQQEEAKRDAAQDKRYYANCPYCLGVNNGDKFCRYCGSSLAYYEDDEKNESRSKNA